MLRKRYARKFFCKNWFLLERLPLRTKSLMFWLFFLGKFVKSHSACPKDFFEENFFGAVLVSISFQCLNNTFWTLHKMFRVLLTKFHVTFPEFFCGDFFLIISVFSFFSYLEEQFFFRRSFLAVLSVSHSTCLWDIFEDIVFLFEKQIFSNAFLSGFEQQSLRF